MSAPFLAAVMGPTGAGKSALAERLAERFDAVLINADAFQVYRGMDIGTAKPTNRERYRLLDLKNPDESFGLGEFVRLAHAELSQLFEQERNVLVVGGTGLYIRALFEEYDNMSESADPALRQTLEARLRDEGLAVLVAELTRLAPELSSGIDVRNPVRVTRALERLQSKGPITRYELPNFHKIKFALAPDQAQLDVSLATRHRVMVQNGWIQEVKSLLLAGYGPDDPGFRAIGYQEWVRHLKGDVGLEEATATMIAETRRYAKRQRTWIRSELNVTLINPDAENAYLEAEMQLQSLSV